MAINSLVILVPHNRSGDQGRLFLMSHNDPATLIGTGGH